MNQFKVNEEIKQIQYFDENHYVLPDGSIVPSVTKKIGDIYSKGNQFNQWLRDTGNESKQIARDAAARGNKIHNAIESMIKGGTISPLGEFGESIAFEKQDWIKLCNFVNWYKDLVNEGRLIPIAVECVVYNEKVAGKIDFVCKLDDKLTIMDWKSGISLHNENYIQQAGYMKLWNESEVMAPGGKIEQAFLVHIGSKHKGQSKGTLHNTGIGVFEVEIDKYTKLWDIAINAWDILFPDHKVPLIDFPLELSLNCGTLKGADIGN